MKFLPALNRFGIGAGRSPHGERGLKCLYCGSRAHKCTVAPRTGSVD